MKFSRISITSKGVELDFERKDDDASEDVKWSSSHTPLSSFRDAMQGFVGYVVDLIPFLQAIQDTLTVTTLNLSEDKNGYRGLIVTAKTPVEKAYNKPLILNTPLVREGSEEASSDAFVLSDEVLELIDLVESEARRFKNGEHEQGELFSKEERTASSENVDEFNERSAAAEVQSTRKPRRGKGKTPPQSETGVAIVVNEPGEPLTDDALRQLLLTVERDLPIDAIATLTSSEREAAASWAIARQQEIVGTLESAMMPAEPPCLLRYATPALVAERAD